MRTVKTRFKYEDDSTRLYSFDCDDSLAAGVKAKIIAINDSLEASTAGGLESFFVSDNGDNLVLIDGATIESVVSTAVIIAPNS